MVAEGCNFNADGSSGGDFNEQYMGAPDGSTPEAEKARDKQQKFWDLLEKEEIVKMLEAELACQDGKGAVRKLEIGNLEKKMGVFWEKSSSEDVGRVPASRKLVGIE